MFGELIMITWACVMWFSCESLLKIECITFKCYWKHSTSELWEYFETIAIYLQIYHVHFWFCLGWHIFIHQQQATDYLGSPPEVRVVFNFPGVVAMWKPSMERSTTSARGRSKRLTCCESQRDESDERLHGWYWNYKSNMKLLNLPQVVCRHECRSLYIQLLHRELYCLRDIYISQ